MPNEKNHSFDEKFKERAVALAEELKDVERAARELEMSDSLLKSWIAAAKAANIREKDLAEFEEEFAESLRKLDEEGDRLRKQSTEIEERRKERGIAMDVSPELKITSAGPLQNGLFDLRYALNNSTGEDIYVFDRIVDRFGMTPMGVQAVRGVRIYAYDLAHITYGGGDLAVFRQGWSDLPKNPDLIPCFAAPAPAASLLRAGETLTCGIRAELPLLEWDDYNGPASETAGFLAITIRQLALKVEYMRGSRKIYVQATDTPGVYGANGHPVETAEAKVALTNPLVLLHGEEKPVAYDPEFEASLKAEVEELLRRKSDKDPN